MPNRNIGLTVPVTSDTTDAAPATGKIRQVIIRCVQILRNFGALAMLEHMRDVLVYQLHARLLDRFASSAEPPFVSQIAELDGLKISGEHLQDAVDYEPTPLLVVRWIMELLPTNLQNWTFIDIGAGRGRVVVMAARFPFHRVVGIEIAAELRRDAQHYIKSLPRELLRADDVEIIDVDAATFEPPTGPCIYYMYNPFNDRVLRKFLQNLVKSCTEQASTALIAYYHPKYWQVLAEFPEIRKCRLPITTRLKFAMLSPCSFELYKIDGQSIRRHGRSRSRAMVTNAKALEIPRR